MTHSTTTSLINLIGNTPLIELESLSYATGCKIYAKAEHLNPGFSVKDRAAIEIIKKAEQDGKLLPGGYVVEGTGGNTGIGMAIICAKLGYKCIFTCPSKTSKEKIQAMEALGAKVHVFPLVPFSDPQHYYHQAKTIAESIPNAIWACQFENEANANAHEFNTGPEIIKQLDGIKIDAIALASGTGGTIGGLASCIRKSYPDLKVFLIDPPGSALKAYVETGELIPTPGSSKLEGIGLDRITTNFKRAFPITKVYNGYDQEALDMAYFLLQKEGLWIGPTAALNIAATVKAAFTLGPGHTIVTILCDTGANYRSKWYSKEWLVEQGLTVSDISSQEALNTLSFIQRE